MPSVFERAVHQVRVCECERSRTDEAGIGAIPSQQGGREKENWEESPRSTDAVQRLRGARACAGLLPEQANANHPSGE